MKLTESNGGVLGPLAQKISIFIGIDKKSTIDETYL